MPHSSGGGSHGGGSHGGHGGSGRSATRTSNRYYPGARAFCYYRHGTPRYVYSDVDLTDPKVMKAQRGAQLFGLVIIGIFIAVLALCLVSEITNPTKLDGTSSYSVAVFDNAEIFTDEEESAIISSLNAFKQETGITPAVMTVYNDAWKSRYGSLENFAYDAYVNNFNDETHWLIVYSQPYEPEADFVDWYWEGMQGDETDGIINGVKLDRFNSNMQKYLTQSTSYAVSQAICAAFDGLTPNIMTREVDFGGILPLGFFLLIMIVIAISIIFTVFVKGYKTTELAEIKNGPKEHPQTVKCEYCGSQYVLGAHTSCPNCAAPIVIEENKTE